MKVLLLDVNWQPVTIIPWEKAMHLIFLEKAETVQDYPDRKIRTVSKEIPAPCVVRINYQSQKTSKVSCSAANVFARDKYTCAYCGHKKSKRELTLDHIYPVSQGGKRTWKNLITACRKCNQRKGARTPKDANMPLLWRPQEPRWSLAFALKLTKDDPIRYWTDYLFGLDQILIQPEEA